MGWISGNYYLSEGEMQNNALIIMSYLLAKGWTLNAVAGMLGNMETESTINPEIWESLTPYDGGYGLVQWTPYNKYTDWADGQGYSWSDGYAQLKWIDELSESSGQWTQNYKMSFPEFKQSTDTPEVLASVFLKNFEKASVEVEAERQLQARKWFNFLQNSGSKNYYIIESAIQWCISIAGDNTHGYDQENRWSPDYDCSSFLITAYEQAGCPVKTNGASYTGDMESAFVKSGFLSIPYTTGMDLIRGDVLLRQGHTEMYIGDGNNVGAHINENGETTGGQTGDQTGDEISITRFEYSGSWTTVLRLPYSNGDYWPTKKRKGFNFVLFNQRRRLYNAKRRI